MDLDGIIRNLEAERARIEEALEVLRRLHKTRRTPKQPDARSSSGAKESSGGDVQQVGDGTE